MPEEAVLSVDTMTNDDYRALRESRKPIVEAEAPPKKTSAVAATEEADTTTDADSETANEDQEQHDEATPKKKGGFQKRIDKLTRQNAELEGRLAQAAAKPVEKAAEPVVEAAGKPESKNFETYEAYVEALTDWKLDAKEAAKTKATADADAAKTAKANAQAWNEQLKDARTRYDDFDEVALADAPISQAVHDAIVGSENGADLAYFLGQNPAERERINALKPVAAMLALGKIAASLDAKADDEGDDAPVTEKPKVSKAPAPIRPLGTKSAIAAKRIDDMSIDEYRAAREAGKLR